MGKMRQIGKNRMRLWAFDPNQGGPSGATEYRRLGMSGGRNWVLGSLGQTTLCRSQQRNVLFQRLDDGRMTMKPLQAKSSVP